MAEENTGAEAGAEQAAEAPAAEGKKAAKVKTIAMARDPEQFPAPHTADVHPDEVDEYAKAGFAPKKAKAE